MKYNEANDFISFQYLIERHEIELKKVEDKYDIDDYHVEYALLRLLKALQDSNLFKVDSINWYRWDSHLMSIPTPEPYSTKEFDMVIWNLLHHLEIDSVFWNTVNNIVSERIEKDKHET